MLLVPARLIIVVAVLATIPSLPGRVIGQDVRVTVLTIMANDRNDHVDPKLVDLAREVRNREKSLTGYRLGNTTTKKISVGQKEAINLFGEKDKQGYSVDVRLLAKDETNKKVTIEVKPPMGGPFIYQTSYDRFFPYVTRAVIDGERLIIATMVAPAK